MWTCLFVLDTPIRRCADCLPVVEIICVLCLVRNLVLTPLRFLPAGKLLFWFYGRFFVSCSTSSASLSHRHVIDTVFSVVPSLIHSCRAPTFRMCDLQLKGDMCIADIFACLCLRFMRCASDVLAHVGACCIVMVMTFGAAIDCSVRDWMIRLSFPWPGRVE